MDYCFYIQRMGGRISDVYLTEHSGLLKNLLLGDVVLADGGFTIRDSARLYCVQNFLHRMIVKLWAELTAE